MIVRRIVSIKPVLHHLIDKPTVDSFVEMRRLDAQQEQAEKNGEPKDQPWDPICFCKAGLPGRQLIAQR